MCYGYGEKEYECGGCQPSKDVQSAGFEEFSQMAKVLKSGVNEECILAYSFLGCPEGQQICESRFESRSAEFLTGCNRSGFRSK